MSERQPTDERRRRSAHGADYWTWKPADIQVQSDSAESRFSRSWQQRPDELVFVDGKPQSRATALAELRRKGLSEAIINLFMETAEIARRR
jgi:hypothetical protein